MSPGIILHLMLLVAAPDGASAQDGKTVFMAKKCAICHSVKALDIKATRPASAGEAIDVSGLSAKYKADWLTRYLKKEEKIDGKAHPPKFKGTDQELDTLVKWLMKVEPIPKK